MSTSQDPKQNYRIPGFAWLGVLLSILAYEIWAVKDKEIPTLSAWVWRTDANHPWFKWVVLVGVGYLMYHFFWEKGWR